MKFTRQNIQINVGVIFVLLSFPIFSIILKSAHVDDLSRLLYTRIFFWGELATLYLYALFIEKKSFLIWEQRSYDAGFFLISVLTLYFLTYAVDVFSLIYLNISHENTTKITHFAEVLNRNKWLVVFTILTAGFTEELVIRGYLMPRLTLLFENNYLPVIVSALIFSFLHLGYHSFFYLILTFFSGLIWGAFYQKYRNIHILICFHILYDTIAIYSHH